MEGVMVEDKPTLSTLYTAYMTTPPTRECTLNGMLRAEQLYSHVTSDCPI